MTNENATFNANSESFRTPRKSAMLAKPSGILGSAELVFIDGAKLG
ncbi:MAG: hypothetical protein ABJP05_05955 [Tateyamaria sp.]